MMNRVEVWWARDYPGAHDNSLVLVEPSHPARALSKILVEGGVQESEAEAMVFQAQANGEIEFTDGSCRAMVNYGKLAEELGRLQKEGRIR